MVGLGSSLTQEVLHSPGAPVGTILGEYHSIIGTMMRTPQYLAGGLRPQGVHAGGQFGKGGRAKTR